VVSDDILEEFAALISRQNPATAGTDCMVTSKWKTSHHRKHKIPKKKNLERKHNHQRGKRDYRASWTLFLRSQHMSHLLHINRINRNSTLANHRLQVVDGPISGTVFHSLTPRPPRDVQARAAVLCTRLKHQVKDVMGNGQRVDCVRGFIIVGRNVAEDQQEG
jgi:hypothetical protein